MGKCKLCQQNVPNTDLKQACTQCIPSEKVFISELLHYATYHYGSSTKDSIKQVIEREFDHQDIVDAKKMLSELNVQVESSDGRRSSPNRSAIEADVADLMNGLENLDKMQDFNPKFTAWDWSKVPKVKPEEATNTVSLAIKVAKLETLYKRLADESASHTESIGNLFDTVAQSHTYASRVAAAPVVLRNQGHEADARQEGARPRTLQPKGPAIQQRPPGGEMGSSRPTRPQVPQEAGSYPHQGRPDTTTRGQHQAALDTPGQLGDQGTGSFQIPREQRRREERNRKRRDNIIMGSKTDTTLQCGSGKVTVLVKYVHKQYDNDNIKAYLQKQKVEVQNVELVSHPDALTKSFKIEIKYDDKTKMLSEDFWPKGIGCRVWRPKQRKQGAHVNTPPGGEGEV